MFEWIFFPRQSETTVTYNYLVRFIDLMAFDQLVNQTFGRGTIGTISTVSYATASFLQLIILKAIHVGYPLLLMASSLSYHLINNRVSPEIFCIHINHLSIPRHLVLS